MEYKKLVVLAVLNFWQHLAQLKDKPLKDRASKEVQALPDLKAEPGQPVTLSERVFHAFAQQNMPVYKPLTLPVTSVDLSCPGTASLHFSRKHACSFHLRVVFIDKAANPAQIMKTPFLL